MFIHFYLNDLNAKDGNTFLNGLVTPQRHRAPGDEKIFKETRSVRSSACSKTYIFVRVRQKTEKYFLPFCVLSDEQAASPSRSHALMAAGSQNHFFFQLNESYRSISNFLLMIKGTQPSLSAVIEFFQCNSFAG
jgi:hypothetical protein